VALSVPGDRRDEDVREIARIVAEAGLFERVFVKRDDALRGRGPDEIPAMLKANLIAFGYPEGQISVVPDERECIDQALHYCQRDDLLLIFGDAVSRCWKQITRHGQTLAGARPAPAPASAPRADDVAALFSDAPVKEGALGDAFFIDGRGVILADAQQGDD
jgi:cyanophycin synthetase